jgi:TRAP-type C4-dicarboxylate transport system permease small subunit
MSIYGRINQVLCWCEKVAIMVAAAILLFVMVLVTYDAIMRYVFNSPLIFQYTLTEEYLLIAIFLLAMPWGFRTGGYIRISGVAALLPGAARNFLLRAGLLVSVAYIAALAFKAFEKFHGLWLSGETRIGIIELPNYLSWICLPIGLGLLAARLLMIAVGPARELHIENDPTEEI